jgi:pimeloyl-ACP methyl ester carboxylesterase
VLQRLAEDVRAVIEALDLDEVVLVGHSLGGNEVSQLLMNSGFERVAGAIYLDSAFGSQTETFFPRLTEILEGLPRPPPPPTNPDEFRTIYGYRMPEVELLNQEAHPNAANVGDRLARDYSTIQVPTLAIYAAFGSPDDFPPWIISALPDPEVRREMVELRTKYLEQNVAIYRQAPGSRVVLLEGADHYVFLTHEQDVLREMRAFLDDLGAEPSP